MKLIWLICLTLASLLSTSVAQYEYLEERHLKGGGGHKHKGGGGGYGHKGGGGEYKPKKCHPQTITKYKTIYKDRKAHVINHAEILHPVAHIKKIKETRYTTVRYPIFITQVIKPLLTQVETKVKPVFFTKTIKKFTTVLFTVTGIGQVTITSVKYEKEYITRCMKKGGYHHRRDSDDGPAVREHDIFLPLGKEYPGEPTQVVLVPPPGIPYGLFHEPNPLEDVREYVISETPQHLQPDPRRNIPKNNDYPRPPPFDPSQRFGFLSRNTYGSPPTQRKRRRPQIAPPRSVIGQFMRPFRRNVNRRGSADNFRGTIGNIKDLYSEDIYSMNPISRSGRAAPFYLEASAAVLQDYLSPVLHPHLDKQPIFIIT